MNRPPHVKKKNATELAHYRWKQRQKVKPEEVPVIREKFVSKSKYTPKS